MARKMDKLSEAVYFAGRSDRTRKGINWSKYWENAKDIFPPRRLNIREDNPENNKEPDDG